jgi:hypothetical protein
MKMQANPATTIATAFGINDAELGSEAVVTGGVGVGPSGEGAGGVSGL